MAVSLTSNGVAPEDRAALRALAEECYQNARQVFSDFGLSAKDNADAMRRASRSRRRMPASVQTLAVFRATGRILAQWRADKRFLGPDGSPKVIPILGRGASFETLARRFGPGLPLNELVTCACRHGDVARSTKQTLALVGSTVLLLPRTPPVMMAILNETFKNLAMTLRTNTNISKGKGFFQRQVSAVLTEREFARVSSDIRPPLQEVCNMVDAAMENAKRRKGRGKRLCGMSLFLFQQDSPDLYSKPPRGRRPAFDSQAKLR